MIIHAAIDIMGGRAVQLVSGDPVDPRVSLPRPGRVARGWAERGFPALHVIDLDAALSKGSNRISIERIIDSVDVPVQVGGGIRSGGEVDRWLEAGAARVIIGTRAVRRPDWLGELAERHPGSILVALDTRGGEVLVRGWTEGSGRSLEDLLAEFEGVPLAGILVTDVAREGTLAGADLELFGRLAAATPHPLYAAGSIRDLDDLRGLRDADVAGAVLGMSIYTGSIDVDELGEEFWR